MPNTKTQVGLRLSAENWHQIRIASFQIGVSASNLMDALCAEWLNGYQLSDPWALGVITSAHERQKETHTRPKRAKPRILAVKAEISPKTAEIAEI